MKSYVCTACEGMFTSTPDKVRNIDGKPYHISCQLKELVKRSHKGDENATVYLELFTKGKDN